MHINSFKKNSLISSTLLFSCSFAVLANEVEEAKFQSQAHLYPQPQQAVESRQQLETKIKAGVTTMLNEPTWEDRMSNAVQYALQKQKKSEDEKKEIIALIAEELKTNGASQKEVIALNTLPKVELKNTLDSIVKNASEDVNQQVVDYGKTIKSAETERVDYEKHSARTQLAKNEVKQRSKTQKGWMYVGQFINKSWSEKHLNIDAGLPKKGQNYLLKVSANLRDSLPSKKLGMSNVVTSLASGAQIKVLNLHPSGRKGHYWALVEWFKQH